MQLRAATNRDDKVRTGYDEIHMLGHTCAWSLENKTLHDGYRMYLQG